MKIITTSSLLILLFGISAIAATIPNYAKEKTWGVQIEDSLMDGEVVWLNANRHAFLAILTEAETTSSKTAIVIHGLGVHPDMQQVIQPIRTGLTSQGYNTLAIQMPVLSNSAESERYIELLDDADARIQAAINYLAKLGKPADLIVAHSLGSVMATHFMAKNSHPFKRFIGIGMPDFVVNFLPKINIPILDLYGMDDIESVLKSVRNRQLASKHNKKYQQKIVKSDHFFDGKDGLLINTVNQWLK